MVTRNPGSLGPLLLRTGLDAPFLAGVVNISIHGGGFLADKEYPTGTIFTVEGGPGGGKPSTVLTAELIHTVRQDDGRWLLGCLFSRALTADDVEKLG
jgi:hypothetical protein